MNSGPVLFVSLTVMIIASLIINIIAVIFFIKDCLAY